MSKITIQDLKEDMTLSEEDVKHVKGGLLLYTYNLSLGEEFMVTGKKVKSIDTLSSGR
jgi:hypothetical protein